MNTIKTLLAASALGVSALSGAAFADDMMKENKETVQLFYDFLSNPSSEEAAAAVKTVMADDWESIGDYSGDVKNPDAFLGQVAGFGQAIPDLNWAVEEMIVSDERVVVRGRASGTPVAPIFGFDTEGRSFEIMSIDIHTLEDGKITTTYHVEDWSGAVEQLKGE